MPENISALLPLLLIAVAFYFLILRPTRTRQAAQRATVARLAPGVRIMTTAGLYGTVVALEGDDIVLEIAPGVTVRYVAAAVAKVLDPEAPTVLDSTPQESRPSIIEGDTAGS